MFLGLGWQNYEDKEPKLIALIILLILHKYIVKMIHYLQSRFGRKLERNISLLVLSFIYVFVWGLTSGDLERYGFGIIYSLIFIFATRAIKDNNKWLFLFSAISIVSFWLSFFLDLKLVMLLSHMLSILFFSMSIVLLAIKLAKAKTISAVEFLEGINLYLLLGITGSLLLSLVYFLEPNAFNASYELNVPADLIYFSFVTLTSLGYGDITPAMAVSKSLSIFLSFSGQIYIAMIVSMLVGKYLNSKTS